MDRTERYEAAEAREAAQNCPRRHAQTIAVCPACKMKVVLHCDSCKIQVSGCFDTDVDRFGEKEARRRMAARRMEKSRSRKLILPDNIPDIHD